MRAALARGARATGVDPAAVMLRTARVLTRHPEAAWLEGTAECLPVGDGEATVLWSIVTIHHWRDVEQGLAEAYRVLAPGGRLLGVERRRREGAIGHGSHGWLDEQADAFAAMSESTGFTDVTVERPRVRRGPLLCVRATRP